MINLVEYVRAFLDTLELSAKYSIEERSRK